MQCALGVLNGWVYVQYVCMGGCRASCVVRGCAWVCVQLLGTPIAHSLGVHTQASREACFTRAAQRIALFTGCRRKNCQTRVSQRMRDAPRHLALTCGDAVVDWTPGVTEGSPAEPELEVPVSEEVRPVQDPLL